MGVSVLATGGIAILVLHGGVDALLEPIAILIATSTGAVIATAALIASKREVRRVTEGRERVRQAEQDFERALRAPTAEGIVVHGDLHGDLYLSTPVEPAPEDQLGDGGVPPSEGRTGSVRQGRGRLTLSELWTVTHRRLDLYHEIALGQASRSFRNAQIAMVLGFGLLVAFLLIALQAGTTAGSVVAGGLGAVAAGLAGYVSRTFVRSQEAAAGHLRAYFDQPLEFSRYLAAERLVADSNLSDEQRAEVVTALAQAIIAGPYAPQGPDTNGSPSGTGGGSA